MSIDEDSSYEPLPNSKATLEAEKVMHEYEFLASKLGEVATTPDEKNAVAQHEIDILTQKIMLEQGLMDVREHFNSLSEAVQEGVDRAITASANQPPEILQHAKKFYEASIGRGVTWSEWISFGAKSEELRNLLQWHAHNRVQSSDPEFEARAEKTRQAYIQDVQFEVDEGRLHPGLLQQIALTRETPIYKADPFDTAFITLSPDPENRIEGFHQYGEYIALDQVTEHTLRHELTHTLGVMQGVPDGFAQEMIDGKIPIDMDFLQEMCRIFTEATTEHLNAFLDNNAQGYYADERSLLGICQSLGGVDDYELSRVYSLREPNAQIPELGRTMQRNLGGDVLSYAYKLAYLVYKQEGLGQVRVKTPTLLLQRLQRQVADSKT